MNFDWDRLTLDDFFLAKRYIGVRRPDVVIMNDDAGVKPYLYRWHVVPRNAEANIYFHIQVMSDPDRPLHDHPWDNMSMILSGGYDEQHFMPVAARQRREPRVSIARKGDCRARVAELAHRLILPEDIPYTMTIFTTGPRRREWGFWLEDGTWKPHLEMIDQLPNGIRQYKSPSTASSSPNQ